MWTAIGWILALLVSLLYADAKVRLILKESEWTHKCADCRAEVNRKMAEKSKSSRPLYRNITKKAVPR